MRRGRRRLRSRAAWNEGAARVNEFWQAVRRAFTGERRGRAIGASVGLFLGLLYLIVGFWDMLFFAIIVGIALWAGDAYDRGASIDWRGIGRWLADRWRGFK